MKASLCKLSPCTVARVCDYHAKLFLVAVSSTLKSLLRPHFLNTPDKSPGDRLTEVCAKITDAGGSCPASRELRVPPRPFAWGHPKPHLRGEVSTTCQARGGGSHRKEWMRPGCHGARPRAGDRHQPRGSISRARLGSGVPAGARHGQAL